MPESFDFQRAFEGVHHRIGELNARLDLLAQRQIEAATSLKSLVGNGQPGRMKLLEDQVHSLEDTRTQAARVPTIENRVGELEENKNEARGVLWAFSIVWSAILGALAWFHLGK